jgi:hypothetical protein
MIRWISVAALVAVLALAAGYFTGKSRGPRGAAGHLRHVLLWSCKKSYALEELTPGKIKEIEGAFRALPSKIPWIERFEWGTDILPSRDRDPGPHPKRCFLLTFKDTQARDAFRLHPAYVEAEKIAQGYGPRKEFDYVAEELPRD